MSSFNLYREAKGSYDKIIPKKEEGLILLSLYEKYGEDEFNEEQIIDVINYTLSDLTGNATRNEYERNNKLIICLQEYFLWRDEIKRTYRLKKYAVEFCSRIHKKLETAYSPAKIKRWFDDLLNKLENQHLEKDGFNLWVEDDWDLRHTILAEQIEILDNQVIESVREFKLQIKKDDDSNSIIQLLKSIEFKLELVKSQADELTKAFQATFDIDDLLTKILENGLDYDSLDQVKKVRAFNHSVRSELEQISKRIEKIKPRIREFIYDFNRRDFDRNSEKFLSYLLSECKSSKKQSSGVRLKLPSSIPNRKVTDNNSVPKFVIVPLKQISSQKITHSKPRRIDYSKREELIKKTQAWKHEKERIYYWVNISFNEVNRNGYLNFTDVFFRILEVEQGNLSIAVKTAQKVLRGGLKDKKMKVSVLQEEKTNRVYKEVSIWEMEIARI